VSDDLSGFSLYELFRTEAESQTVILSEGILALEHSGNAPTSNSARSDTRTLCGTRPAAAVWLVSFSAHG
jgi:hypothetical protein